MLGSRRTATVTAEGLKIKGSLTADGPVEVNGEIEGEIQCTSLVVSRKARVAGTITAQRIVVDGTVEGPINGGDVVLKSRAHVIGDIHQTSLTIEKGAYLEGRIIQSRNADQPDAKAERKTRPDIPADNHTTKAAKAEKS
ncbi:MAG TPA: polymer-forming cytoskeletal protein [Hyphomicrobiaceae bacterium]|nr:polymer-forming cytoskeletal protein [Hyphomicrobiaceae bacterium]